MASRSGGEHGLANSIIKNKTSEKIPQNINRQSSEICQTWGINSLTGSLTNFRGELKVEGPTLCFITRGEPEVLLLGDSGGALPAGNMEGNELLAAAFVAEEFPGTFKGTPAFASFSNEVTYSQGTRNVLK